MNLKNNQHFRYFKTKLLIKYSLDIKNRILKIKPLTIIKFCNFEKIKFKFKILIKKQLMSYVEKSYRLFVSILRTVIWHVRR